MVHLWVLPFTGVWCSPGIGYPADHGRCLYSLEFTESWLGKATVPPPTDTKLGGVIDQVAVLPFKGTLGCWKMAGQQAGKLLSREGLWRPVLQQVKHEPAMHPRSKEGQTSLGCIRSAEEM